MTREERDQLLVRYNHGELSPLERERLFTEALRDQELFETLFEDEALNEALADEAVRRDVLAAPLPERSRRGQRWRMAALAAVAAAVVIAVVLVPTGREEPVMVARQMPEPVRSIEPVAAPMPTTLSLPAVEKRDVVVARAPAAARTAAAAAPPAESEVRVFADVAEKTEKSAAAELSVAAGQAPAAMMARSVVVPAVVETRLEVQMEDGSWRAAREEGVLPAGRAARLAVTARGAVNVRVGGEGVALSAGATHYFRLPALAAGEHEIRVEWSGAAEAEMVSTLADAGRTAERTAGRAFPPAGSRVVRVRVK